MRGHERANARVTMLTCSTPRGAILVGALDANDSHRAELTRNEAVCRIMLQVGQAE